MFIGVFCAYALSTKIECSIDSISILGRLEELEQDQALIADPKCKPGEYQRLANEENCARYHECTGASVPVEMECPYPRLYNRKTSRCEIYMFVNCDHRKEPKDPCKV